MSYSKSIIILAISLSVWQVASASSDTGTLLVGVGPASFCPLSPSPLPDYFGFEASLSIGSYSPTGLTGGKTVADLVDSSAGLDCVMPAFSEIVISGFSSNPGHSWLSSVKCGSLTNAGSSATYSYSGGSANWTWSTKFGFLSQYNTNVSCTIVHN